MAENLYTVQKTYEALAPTDTQAQATLAFDESRIFKTEFERQSYLVRLTGADLQAAIMWLETKGNEGVSNHADMLRLLKLKQNELTTIQTVTRTALEGHKLVINKFLPKVVEGGTVATPTPAVVPPVIAKAPVAKATADAISEEQFQEIEDILENKSSNVTNSVRKNAKEIVAALKLGKNPTVVKGAITSLLNEQEDGEDFQNAFGMKPDGGVIGPITIRKFLEKAGVPDVDVKKLMAKLEVKKVATPAPAAPATPVVPATPVAGVAPAAKPVAGAPTASEKSDKTPTLTLSKDNTIMNGKKPYTGTIDAKTPLDFGDGVTYSGGVKDGKFEGKGKLTYENGNIYEGDFKDDSKDGKGKLTYKSGGVYEGDFKNDYMSGNGKFTYEKGGDVYEGGFIEGRREGQGKITYKNGDIYLGAHKNDKREGQGKFTFVKSGEIYEGIWRANFIYAGTVKNAQNIVLQKYQDGKQVSLSATEKSTLRDYRITDYLTTKRFTSMGNGRFVSPDKDLTFIIQGDIVDHERSLGRAFGSYEFSDTEKAWESQLTKILDETK